MGLREIDWEDVNWIHLAQDWDQWRALLDTVMFGLHKKAGNFLTVLSDCSMQLVS